MMDRRTLFYMHTIDGKPGYFDGEQIVYAHQRDHWQDDYHVAVLCASEEQIRKEQAASREYRRAHKWDDSIYDFVVVSLLDGVLPPPGQNRLHYGGRRHPGLAPSDRS